MAVPNNILQQVITYQLSELAFLQNLCCFVATANTKFLNFNDEIANLGNTVSFDLPPKSRAQDGLVVTFQGAEQRVQNLVCDQSANVGYAVTNEQLIFNLEANDYMEKFGKSAIINLGSTIEANVALNAITNTYRFYGTPSAPINTFGGLAQMLADYRDYGSTYDNLKVYLPSVDVPPIVNSGLNQFVMDRNEEIAMSWFIGNWMGVEFYQSNLLPTHVAGNVGNLAQTLTLTAVNDNTGVNVTQLTFSGASASDANAFKANDLIQFADGVSGESNVRFLTFNGQQTSSQPLQLRVTANAASDVSGNVTVTISPAVVWAQTINQNINVALSPGMQITALPSHRAGLVVGGNALFLAMPRLPDQMPFPTGNAVDEETGVSIRNYYGSLFGQNQMGYVHDALWGSTLVPEYAMRLIFPV